MSRRLPPLNAVRAFEASARLGSMALAAAELCVTSGAVSQQVAKLEDFYGRQLFIRRSHQLLLTDTGQAVFAACAELMDQLAGLTDRIVGGTGTTPLVVSALPAIGLRWLAPRLAQFLDRHPDIRLDLRLEEDPVDFQRTRIDVRLAYGEHLYPDLQTVAFARDEVTPLCAPQWLERGRCTVGDPASLTDADLIHVQWRTGFSSYPTWEAWLAAAGAARQPDNEQGHRTDTASVALELAEVGAGIVLGQSMLAEGALRSGRLVAPFPQTVSLPHAYCVVHSPAVRRNPAVRAFVDWLLESGSGV